MAFEDIKAEIGLLMGRMIDQPHDKHEMEAMLREKLAEMKAYGMPLPQDLLDLEALLDRNLAVEARRAQRPMDGE